MFLHVLFSATDFDARAAIYFTKQKTVKRLLRRSGRGEDGAFVDARG